MVRANGSQVSRLDRVPQNFFSRALLKEELALYCKKT